MASSATSIALAAALSLAAVGLPPSAPAASGGGQCFYITQVNGYRAADARTIYARISGRQIWRIDLKSDCEGLPGTSQTMILEPLVSGSICGPLDANLSIETHGTRHRCLIGAITRLSADEAASVPANQLP